MGKLACPICIGQSKAFIFKHSHKTSFFDCHWQFLPCDHVYRKNKNAFKKGHDETNVPPRRLAGEEMWEMVKDLPSIVQSIGEHPIGYGISHN